MTTSTIEPSAPADAPRSGTRWLVAGARLLLGLAFSVFGLNAFLNFIPPPPPDQMPAEAMAFAGALVETGYMMPLIGVTQLLAGLLLLANRFVPLALAFLAPFLVNAVAFHLFLEPSGLIMALIFSALTGYLAWAYRDAYRPMLKARVS